MVTRQRTGCRLHGERDYDRSSPVHRCRLCVRLRSEYGPDIDWWHERDEQSARHEIERLVERVERGYFEVGR